MNPSTTARETSSRFPMRARTAGSMKRAPGTTWVSRMSHAGTRQRDHFEQALDDIVGGNAFGLSVEIGDDPVTQHRMRQRADVLETHVIAAAGQGPRLGAEHQVLRGADAGAERHPLLDEV